MTDRTFGFPICDGIASDFCLLRWRPLSPWTRALDNSWYAPRVWERWFHAVYFGEVYYWKRGLTVIPYHFKQHLLYVPMMQWKDKRRRVVTGRGYERNSKRFRGNRFTW